MGSHNAVTTTKVTLMAPQKREDMTALISLIATSVKRTTGNVFRRVPPALIRIFKKFASLPKDSMVCVVRDTTPNNYGVDSFSIRIWWPGILHMKFELDKTKFNYYL